MSGISRFISFVIGLIVLILLFVLIANRFNANKNRTVAANVTPTVIPSVTPKKANTGFDFFGLFRRNTPTPSPTPTLTFAQQMNTTLGTLSPTPTPSPTQAPIANNNYQTNQPMPTQIPQKPQNLTTTPKTGTETLVLPLASAAFFAGMWLRRRK